MNEKPFFFKIVEKFFKQNKKMFLFFFVITFTLYAIQNITFSKLMSKIYSQANDKQKIKKNLIYLFIIMGFLLILYTLKNYCEMKLIPKFVKEIRQTLFSETLKNEDVINKIELGKYVKNSGDFTEYLKYIFINTFHEIIKTMVIPLFIFIYLLFNYPRLAIIFGILWGLFLYISSGILKIIQLNKEKEDKYSKLTEKMHEKLFQLDNIYYNNTANEELKDNEKMLETYSKFSEYCYKQQVYFFAKIIFILIITIIILMIYTFKYYSGQDFILLTILFLLYFNNMISFANICYIFSSKLGELLSLNEYFEFIFKNDSKNKNTNLKTEIIQNKNINFGNIEIKNISFSFNNEKKENAYLFKNISLETKLGDKVFIIGKSGCGKTTFMKILLQFLKPNQGTIYIDQIQQDKISKELLREKIIYMNQKTSIFNSTILENIQYGNNCTKEEVFNLLKKYKLETYFGIDLEKQVGIFGNQISLGMQKIILVLRTLLKKNYDTILFDEPTTSLDPYTKQKVMEMIWKETKDKTVFIITHDLEFLQQYQGKVIKLC